MVTTTTDRAEVFSRPAARFDADGNLEVRASSALGCRRALWYAATGYEPTTPPSEESLTAMEAGNVLEPVVVRAMERAGWKVDAADAQEALQASRPGHSGDLEDADGRRAALQASEGP